MQKLNFTYKPINTIKIVEKEIFQFRKNAKTHIDNKTIQSFGEEWKTFNSFESDEINKIAQEYFDILPERILGKHTYVLDAGCGTGRWSLYLANKVGMIEAIDPSDAVFSAAGLLKNIQNVRISQVTIEHLPFPENSFDLIISLGVLHHISDTKKALQQLVKKLKPGGYILLYLYYNLENKPLLYKLIFICSNFLRRIISSFPHKIKLIISNIIATIIYFPLSRLAKTIKNLFKSEKLYKNIPLYYYADKNFKIMRNDALDRFGTPLEKRFSKKEIEELLSESGLKDIKFSPNEPYWHVIARKNNSKNS